MGDFVSLVCPACGAQVRATEQSDRYVCAYCGTEHIVRGATSTEEGSRGVESGPRAPVPKPDSVRVEKDQQSARIVRRWFSLKYIPMAFFCVFWDGFLCFWYSMAFSQDNAPLVMILFPIIHVAVGVGLTYSTLAGFINRSVLEVEREEISVWHEPLPWTGDKTIKTGNVKQFYSTEKYKRTKNGGHYAYDLYVLTKDGQRIKLLSDLENPDIALYFEQQLETWLRIEDAPVHGELQRHRY